MNTVEKRKYRGMQVLLSQKKQSYFISFHWMDYKIPTKAYVMSDFLSTHFVTRFLKMWGKGQVSQETVCGKMLASLLPKEILCLLKEPSKSWTKGQTVIESHKHIEPCCFQGSVGFLVSWIVWVISGTTRSNLHKTLKETLGIMQEAIHERISFYFVSTFVCTFTKIRTKYLVFTSHIVCQMQGKVYFKFGEKIMF